MSAKRIIARLDVKGNKLIKGVHLEGWRFLGDPNEFCVKYYEDGIDEVIYIDAVASLYGRENLKAVVEKTTENVFIPITAGGGIRNVNDAYELLRAGADKVAINSGAIKNPELITEISNAFGVQCVVVSIQAKRVENDWVACFDSAREITSLNVLDWAKKVEDFGAGEILLTSVDRDGTSRGMDVELISLVSDCVSIPVIACGGFSKVEDFVSAIKVGNADAVACSKSLHFNKIVVNDIKNHALSKNIDVRI